MEIRKEVITTANPNFAVVGPGVADRKIEVAKYTVPDNTRFGLENGAQLVMKLYDGSGNEISRDTYVYIYAKRGGFDGEEFVAKIPYSVYYDLSIGDQRNQKFRDQTRVNFAKPVKGVALGPGDELQIWVESPDVVDMTDGKTVFEIEALVRPQ